MQCKYNVYEVSKTNKQKSAVGLLLFKGWGVALLVEHQTGTPSHAGSIPRCGKGIFLPESTFSADYVIVSTHHRVQLHALTYVHRLKILWFMLQTPGMHHRLDSATL